MWNDYCEKIGACYGPEFVSGAAELDDIEYDYAEFKPEASIFIGANNSASTVDLLQPKLRKLFKHGGNDIVDDDVDSAVDTTDNVTNNVPYTIHDLVNDAVISDEEAPIDILNAVDASAAVHDQTLLGDALDADYDLAKSIE